MQQSVIRAPWQRWAPILAAAFAATCAWVIVHVGCDSSTDSGTPPVAADASSEADVVPAGDAGIDQAFDGPPDSSSEDAASDAETDATVAWPLDPDGWVRMKNEFEWLEPCELWKAELSKVDVPGLEWKSCGDGCEIADVSAGISVAYDNSGGDTLSNVPYAQIWNGRSDDSGPKQFGRIINLATGRVLHAFRLHDVAQGGFSTCSAGRGTYSPALLSVTNSANQHSTLVWNWQSNTWTNTFPPADRSASGFADSIGGLVSVGGQADIFFSPTVRPPAYATIFAGAAGPSPARGDQILFPDWRVLTPGDHGRLASWAPSTGVQTLYEGTDEPMTAALSDSNMVWVSVPDLDHADSGPDDLARFYWSPRASTATNVNAHAGGLIPNAPAYVDWQLKTHGDYAAVVSWVPAWTIPADAIHDRWFTAVTQLSTGKVWTIKATRADHSPAQVWAVSGTHVYVAEAPLVQSNPTEVVRYAIDNLDVLQAR